MLFQHLLLLANEHSIQVVEKSNEENKLMEAETKCTQCSQTSISSLFSEDALRYL